MDWTAGMCTCRLGWWNLTGSNGTHATGDAAHALGIILTMSANKSSWFSDTVLWLSNEDLTIWSTLSSSSTESWTGVFTIHIFLCPLNVGSKIVVDVHLGTDLPIFMRSGHPLESWVFMIAESMVWTLFLLGFEESSISESSVRKSIWLRSSLFRMPSESIRLGTYCDLLEVSRDMLWISSYKHSYWFSPLTCDVKPIRHMTAPI